MRLAVFSFVVLVVCGFSSALTACASPVFSGKFTPQSLKKWSCYQRRGGKVKLHSVTSLSGGNHGYVLVCNGDINNKYNDFIALIQKLDICLDGNSTYRLSITANAKVNYRPGKKFCVAIRQINAGKKTLSYKKAYFELKKSGFATCSIEFKPDKAAKKFQIYLISSYLTSRDKVLVKEVKLEKVDK